MTRRTLPFTRATPCLSASTAARTTTKLVLIGEDEPDPVPLLPVQHGKPGGRYPRAAHTSPRAAGRPRDISSPPPSRATAKHSSRTPSAWISVCAETVSRISARHATSTPTSISSSTSAVRTSKCFKIQNKCIDNISLNEACSSGCGSFIETFARSMGYSIEEFCKLGLFAKHPIDLGSRCTVFMNSSVKQAQKDGATESTRYLGWSVRVGRQERALQGHPRPFGPMTSARHIVVQGGTFLNNAMLRSFEQEISRNVARPAISGLMGAYGAALHAKDNRRETTTLVGTDVLAGFEHNVRSTRCGLCENHCSLTINNFGGGRRFISGNRCAASARRHEKSRPAQSLYNGSSKSSAATASHPATRTRSRPSVCRSASTTSSCCRSGRSSCARLGFGTLTSDVSTRDTYMQRGSIPFRRIESSPLPGQAHARSHRKSA